MRRCSVCVTEKAETEFYKTSGNRCKDCHNVRCGQWNKSNRDKTVEYGRKWQRANREKSSNAAKRWQALNPEKCKVANRRRALKRNYGLSTEQFDEMFAKQNGCCAICGQPEQDKRRLDVDHNHETDVVRALLCSGCNAGLGQFGDRVETLQRAVAYLTTHNRLAEQSEFPDVRLLEV